MLPLGRIILRPSRSPFAGSGGSSVPDLFLVGRSRGLFELLTGESEGSPVGLLLSRLAADHNFRIFRPPGSRGLSLRPLGLVAFYSRRQPRGKRSETQTRGRGVPGSAPDIGRSWAHLARPLARGCPEAAVVPSVGPALELLDVRGLTWARPAAAVRGASLWSGSRERTRVG